MYCFFLARTILLHSMSIGRRESLTVSWLRALLSISRSDAAISLWIRLICSAMSSLSINLAVKIRFR